MNDRNSIIEEFYKNISQINKAEEIITILKKINILSGDEKIDKRDEGLLQNMAFTALRDLTIDTPDKAKNLIIQYLLPLCIQDAISEQEKYNRHECREHLVKWITQYSPKDFIPLREKILDQLSNSLKEATQEGACWTLAAIGFRRGDIVKILMHLISKQDDNSGDTAIAALISLGVSEEDREKLLEEIHSRIKKRYNRPLLIGLSKLADSKSIEPLLSNWLITNKAKLDDIEFELALGILPKIADSNPDNTYLQDNCWDKLIESLNANVKENEVEARLSFRSNLTSQFNSSSVIKYLLNLLKYYSESELGLHRRYLIELRLSECVRPRQLEAWQSPEKEQLLNVLKFDACMDTKAAGRWNTKEMDRKKMAWETILRLGCSQALDWFETAVAQETNSFVRNSICEYFACFHINPLPDSLVNWIMERYDKGKNKTSEEWVFRLGAIEVAWSSGTIQAFEALLNFGFTFEDQVPRKVVDALAAVSYKLTQEGNSYIPKKLLETLKNGKERHQQIAAAGALRVLAEQKVFPNEFISIFEEILFDSSRDEYQLALVANTFGYLPKDNISEKTWHCLNKLSMNEENDWISSHALEALARQDRLIEFEDLLTTKLGFRKNDNQWDIPPQKASHEWSSYFAAWLYRYHPKEFSPAIITILNSHQWPSVIQLLDFWKNYEMENFSISDKMAAALIQRATRQKPSYGEKQLFQYLAYLIPEKFINHPWEKYSKHWHPECRQALADALEETPIIKTEDKVRLIRLLTILMDDGLYGVRRSAYRALSAQSGKSLFDWIKTFSQADAPPERRKRAAEAWGWLSELEDMLIENKRLYTILVAIQNLKLDIAY